MKPSILTCLGMLMLGLYGFQPASACVTIDRTLCFAEQEPDSLWHSWSQDMQGHWGIHAGDYYDEFCCPNDDHSLWCYGYPPGNDPEFDDYPSNYDSYDIYGPIDLDEAEFAQIEWRMWNGVEESGDSVFWGASTQLFLTNEAMSLGGSEAMDTDDWESYWMDLSRLRDYITGDSVSMLGLDSVYVFWRFRSNGNPIRDIGTFLDCIAITVENNAAPDLIQGTLQITYLDGNVAGTEIVQGDTIQARCEWSANGGGPDIYAPFHVIVTVNDSLIADEVFNDMHCNEMRDLTSPAWIVSDTGSFTVRVKLDSLGQIMESDESNNAATVTYHVSPLAADKVRVESLPQTMYLEPNYPNPFNPATEIRYGIKVPGDVTLRVYDVLGRDVVMLVNAHREPGSYAVRFDGEGLPSGLYMYVLTTPEGTIGRKMMLLK